MAPVATAPEGEQVGRRFIASLDGFKKTILSFNFYEDIGDDKNTDKVLEEVPEHFDNVDHYRRVLFPLYWEEMKAEINRAKQFEMPDNPEPAHHIRFSLDSPLIRLELQRNETEATTVFYSTMDLVLLTQNSDHKVEEPKHCLALVEQSVGSKVIVVVLEDTSERMMTVAKLIASGAKWHIAKVLSTQTMVREYEGLAALHTLPLRDTIVNSDDSLRNVDNSTEMQAAPAPMGFKEGRADDDVKWFVIPEILQTKLNSMYNDGQRCAISDSRKMTGITLVQGPPGTGKTKTILGILTVLLNSQAREVKSVSYSRTGSKRKRGEGDAEENDDDSESSSEQCAPNEHERTERLRRIRARFPWLQSGFEPWTSLPNLEVLAPGARELARPYPQVTADGIVNMSEVASDARPRKVLVCTPSNAAVDEVLRRVGSDGIMDASGKTIKRCAIRLGPNFAQDVSLHGLENMVKRRLAAKCDMPDLNRQEMEKEKLLREAEILFTTLSISGSRDMVGFPGDIDTVVMDEASQGLEVSTLVPLKLGCLRLIMVGDPQQLPATCFSSVAQKHNYERSLFQRLQASNHKVNMLQIQYRMHPHISRFPSQRFYDGRLIDALGIADYEARFPTQWWEIPCFGPICFFNLKGTQSRAQASFVNDDEANFVLHMFVTLSALYPKEPWRDRLAVISPYREQVQLIRRKFKNLFNLPSKAPCPVEVNTVDGFQGREKDCIIVSVVRADTESKSIGFVRDKRRMNVAFTRARQSLWVVGYADVLSRNEDWKDFINMQRDNARLLRTNEPHRSWLKRYLRNWYDRNPSLKRPGPEIIGEVGEEEPEATVAGEGFNLSEADLEELEKREKLQETYARPDIEEMSQDGEMSDADLDGAASDKDDVKEKVGKKGGAGKEGGGD